MKKGTQSWGPHLTGTPRKEAGPVWDTYIVKLVVEPTRITDGVSVGISSPERRGGGLTVRTGRTCPSCCRLVVGGGGGEREREGVKIKTIEKWVFQNHRDTLTKRIRKKSALKSKLASGPHESNQDPQKLPQEETCSRFPSIGACHSVVKGPEFRLPLDGAEWGGSESQRHRPERMVP